MKGVGWLFEMPYNIVWVLSLLIFVDINVSPSLANLYFKFYLAYIAFYYINKGLLKKQNVELNSVSGNTFQSISLAILVFVLWMAFIVLITPLFGNYFSASTTSIDFFENTASAFIGASKEPILSKSHFWLITNFGGLIPYIETVFVGAFLALLLYIFRVNFSEQKRFTMLKNPKFLALNTILATIITWYHLNAKGVSDFPLLMVFGFFWLTGALIFSKIVGRKYELETAVWLHIINNTVAILSQLGYMAVILRWF